MKLSEALHKVAQEAAAPAPQGTGYPELDRKKKEFDANFELDVKEKKMEEAIEQEREKVKQQLEQEAVQEQARVAAEQAAQAAQPIQPMGAQPPMPAQNQMQAVPIPKAAQAQDKGSLKTLLVKLMNTKKITEQVKADNAKPIEKTEVDKALADMHEKKGAAIRNDMLSDAILAVMQKQAQAQDANLPKALPPTGISMHKCDKCGEPGDACKCPKEGDLTAALKAKSDKGE